MYNAVEFRQRAEQCMQQASNPAMPRSQQRILLQMAAKWIALAEDAERICALFGEDAPQPSEQSRREL